MTTGTMRTTTRWRYRTPARGPIIVRRPVYDEGMKMLDKAAPEDGTRSRRRAAMAQDCKWAHEEDKADYWDEVADFLEWREAAPKDVEIVVLEEGEEWDSPRGEKIKSRKKVKSGKKVKSRKKKVRAGKNRPRSGKGT